MKRKPEFTPKQKQVINRRFSMKDLKNITEKDYERLLSKYLTGDQKAYINQDYVSETEIPFSDVVHDCSCQMNDGQKASYEDIRDTVIYENVFKDEDGFDQGSLTDFGWGCLSKELRKKFLHELVASARLTTSQKELFQKLYIDGVSDQDHVIKKNMTIRSFKRLKSRMDERLRKHVLSSIEQSDSRFLSHLVSIDFMCPDRRIRSAIGRNQKKTSKPKTILRKRRGKRTIDCVLFKRLIS